MWDTLFNQVRKEETTMKNIIISEREMAKARKSVKDRIPASERPWARPTVFKSRKAYTRKGKGGRNED